MILGIDVSTSVTAFAVVRNEDGQLVEDSSLQFTAKTKYPTIYHKAIAVKNELERLKDKYQIDEIFIEEALMNFKFGATSAQTLSLLHKFNGTVSQYVFDVFEKAPTHINAGSARKLAGVKKCEMKHEHASAVGETKQKVFEYLAKTEKKFEWLTTRTGSVKQEAYDRADAIIVAKAGAVQCKKNSESSKTS